jgi:hypothetical protein
MSGYHHALDAYHAAFRIIRILAYNPDRGYEVDKLRILDFYVAFPHLIGKMQLPRPLLSARKAFADYENEYIFSGSPRLVFMRMLPLQVAAIRLLLSADVLDTDAYRNGVIKLGAVTLPHELGVAITERNKAQDSLLAFLTNRLADVPLLGVGGLKARTGLLEYRYDDA